MHAKKILAGLLIAPVILSSCGSAADEGANTEATPGISVVTQTVAKKPFAEEIRLIGRVSGSRETQISALVSGTVKTVNAQAGQRVKAGETLASIDYSSSTLGVSADTAATAYSNALISYQNAQVANQKDAEAAKTQLENAKLNKTNTYASTDKQLAIAQTQLDNAVTSRTNTYDTTDKQLVIAQTQLANIGTTKQNTTATTNEAASSAKISVSLAEKSVANASLALDNFEKNSAETLKTLEDKRTGLYATAKVGIESAKTSVDSAITQADQILGITDKYRDANDLYEPYLARKDIDTKNKAEVSFNAANDAFVAYKASEDLGSEQGIRDSLDKLTVVFDRIVTLYEDLTDVLDATLVSGSFTSAQLEALKTTVSTKQNTTIAAKSSFVSTKNGLQDIDNSLSSTRTSTETTRASLKVALGIAEDQLANAKQGLSSIEAGNTSSLDSVSGNENLLKNQLESTIAGIRATRDSADSAMRLAKEQYESTVLGVKTARDNADSALTLAQAQYDSTRAKLESSLASSRTQVDSARGGRDSAVIQYDNGLIKAPFDGVILQKNVEVGSAVSPGVTAFVIASDESYLVRMDVSSDSASILALGQSASIVRGGRTYTGAISLVSAGADPTTKLLRAEAVFSDKEAARRDLVVGDFVDVYVARAQADREALLVPFAAVLSGEQGTYSVYVVGS
jgi:multidrug efflux pump subunit AcrA (membrane-fusion protein)